MGADPGRLQVLRGLWAGAAKIRSLTAASASLESAAPPPKPEIHVFIENEKGKPEEVLPAR